MAKNLPNLRREKDIQIYEVIKTPNRLSPKGATLKHIIIIKSQRILKLREKLPIREPLIRLLTGFFNRNLGQEGMK